jgi:integrase/recombinase XerD
MQTDIISIPQEVTITNQSRIDELLGAFIADQDVKESSKMLYKRTMKQYFKWINARSLDMASITRVDILAYKDHLLTSGLTSLSVGSYITSVRRFYEWAEANKYYPNVAKGVKSPKRKQQFKKQALTQLQSVELVAHARQCSTRDFAIVTLLIRTGLRTIEVIRASIQDIEYRAGKRVLMVHGKGRDEKDNFVIITDKCWAPIETYLGTRPDALPTDPLFTSRSNNSRGQKLTTHSVSKIAKRCLKHIGLNNKHYTAHSLRHTTAVNILRAGGRIEDAQGVLRHSSPATTQIYTASIKEEMRLRNAPEELLDDIF